MKSTQTLCELLIFIICMCILLFCFKSFFLSVLLQCFPAVLAHFVRHFPVARGRFYFFTPTMFYFGKFRVRFFCLWTCSPPKSCHSTDCLFCTWSVFNVSGFQPLEISFKLKKQLTNCTVILLFLNTHTVGQEQGQALLCIVLL